MFKAFHIKNVSPFERENLAAVLLMNGALGSEEKDDLLICYFDESEEKARSIIDEVLRELKMDSAVMFREEDIKNENWNENWKNYFKPVIVGKFCVRPPWEKCQDDKRELIISPKMAFGTGTHETTGLMLEYLSDLDLKGKKVLDAGCGSGILSIASILRGADSVTAFDVDRLAIENSGENITLNGAENIKLILGDITGVGESEFDLLLANINTDVLLKSALSFFEKLKEGGKLALSGLLLTDASKLRKTYENLGFILSSEAEAGEWGLLEFTKGRI